MLTEAEQLLQRYFGYPSFRNGQKQIVERVLAGQNSLGIMPTGGGKSICYQIPAMLMPGVTLVISPLISLMKDQVDALNQAGIPATYINSSISQQELEDRLMRMMREDYKLIYIAPERLGDSYFQSMISRIEITMIAIDEAHCISQWGHDFRPSYRSISTYIDSLQPKPLILALTATATEQVQEDICRHLHIEDENTVVTGARRDNLLLQVVKGQDKFTFVRNYLKNHSLDSGIIYTSTRKQADALYEKLLEKGIKVGKYHGGLNEHDRADSQEAFLRDDINVMVATNAFGMGIDKSNVRFVIHYNLARTIEAYYQEAGRAGRDGVDSECILLFSADDIRIQKFLIEQSEIAEERKGLEYKKLQQMVDYCHTDGCLQQYIGRYFNDIFEPCGKCSNCTDDTESIDLTKEAQMVFSCVKRMNEAFGRTLVAQVLTGSKNQKVTSLRFDKLSTYGLLKHWSAKNVAALIDFLVAEQFLQTSEGAYPTVKLTTNAVEVLKGGKLVFKRERREETSVQANNDIFEELRQWRKELATEANVPPYVIFSDKTLREVSKIIPLSNEELLQIHGIGEQKLVKYGEALLAFLQPFEDQKKEAEPKLASVQQSMKPKTPSHLITLELFRQGLTPGDIATQRESSVETILTHLEKCKDSGEDIDLSQFINEQHQPLIKAAIEKVGAERLKPIKEELPDEVTYFEIRYTLQQLAEQN
ncbi:DNA helicase RecQ [Bacillus alkalicellulosilyticus]|uniref:DNA helicase RecQ n=1 Tax=Alkalihalobacterium alkalicellulosilyticum TaxID=1912214 RepID=UPI000996469A|nr:DNA helicase RecQ [Bacillus alkalicellulosilyticus]